MLSFRFGFHWFGEDGIAVKTVKYHYILIARTRSYWEAACQIGGYLASHVNDGRIEVVGAFVRL
jgi:hypothetical protein